MKFLTTRFRSLVCLFLCTMLCIVSAAAVSSRSVGGDTTITVDGVTYVFRGHINYSAEDGSIFFGASVNSSKLMPANRFGISLTAYNTDNDEIVSTVVVYNTADNRSITITPSKKVTTPGVYYCIPRLYVVSASGVRTSYEGIATPRLRYPR